MIPWTVARQASLSMGILQARILERVAMPSSGDLPNPGIEPRSPALQGDSLPAEPQGKPVHRLYPNKKKQKVFLKSIRFINILFLRPYSQLRRLSFIISSLLLIISFSWFYFCSLSQICLILLPIFWAPVTFLLQYYPDWACCFCHFLSVSSCILLSFMALKQIRCHPSVPNP